MTGLQSPRFHLASPLFSADWVGRDPHSRQPRMVHCFGPSEPDDFASVQAAVLGLGSLLAGDPTELTRVWGAVEDDRFVLHCRDDGTPDYVVLRTDPLPQMLTNVLRWRPEVMLVWVDVPLRDPLADLRTVGAQHIWTGVASVRRVHGAISPGFVAR